jgi:hypothetical protein
MEKKLIGRIDEKKILEEALQSDEAEMVAVLGRRRIGKTYLVNQIYGNHLVFELTGTQHALTEVQLKNFRDTLARHVNTNLPLAVPEDWFSAFNQLRQYLETLDLSEKKVLFFDELPWLASPKSGFLEALGYFWNTYVSRQNLVLVICGSAASWMIKKVVYDRGGLHNRITKTIHLQPFSLKETEAYLNSRGVLMDRFQLVHLYMALGGIPHYLKNVKAGLSAVQNIDKLCFSESGSLRNEFSKLYPALFKSPTQHIEVIRALSETWKGLDRNEIVAKISAKSGQGITTTLEELEQSGFITAYSPFGYAKRNKVFRLTDSYSLFYLKFIENSTLDNPGTWLQMSQTQAYKSWSGYAFENICLKHIPQIKKAMDIAGIYSQASSFYQKASEAHKGAQIDLVLDRKDHIINLFEIKFYDEVFVPNAHFASSLRDKKSVFKLISNTRSHLSWVLVSTYGLQANQHSIGLVDHVLTLEDLFVEI